MKRIRLDFAVAAVVLMPFVTVGLDFRLSLIVQAVGILAIVLATLPTPASAEGWRRVLAAPRPVVLGIAAVAAATVLGAAMGLVRGHALAQVAGQALSMGLLPLAAVGGLTAWTGSQEKHWRTGLLAALALGCCIQLLWGFVMIVVLGEPSRLFLPNSVSVIGPTLLGLCFSLVSLRDPNRWLRRLAWLATVSILLVILGSSLRSLWILAPVTVVGVVVVWRGVRSRETAIALMVVAVLAFAMVGAVWKLESWTLKDRPDILQQTPCSLFPTAGNCVDGSLDVVPDRGRRFWIDAPLDLPEAEAWRVMVRGRGEGKGTMVVALLFFDDQGHVLGRIPVPIHAGEEGSVGVTVGTTPQNWTEARIRLSRRKQPEGKWRLDAVECAPLDSPVLVHLAGKARALEERVWGLILAVKTGRAGRDATLGFRWYESQKVVEVLTKSSWFERLFGHGLGASIRLDVDGFDNRGHWIHYDDVNYIHNWYLFLPFKLGLVGSALVLSALIGWIGWTIRSAGRVADPGARAFLAAASAAWIVYAIWSLTSPEILDFRMAPLWGWLLGASVSQAIQPATGDGT